MDIRSRLASVSFPVLCLTLSTAAFAAQVGEGRGGDANANAPGGRPNEVSSKRADAVQVEIADYSCSGPNLKAEVRGSVLCKVGKGGEIADCDPENVYEERSKKNSLSKVLEKINIEAAKKEDLRPDALNTPNHPDEGKNLKALNIKLKRLSAKLAYLNSAKNAVHAKVLNGTGKPDELKKWNAAEDRLGKSLDKTIKECDLLQKRIYRDGKRGIVCEDGAPARN